MDGEHQQKEQYTGWGWLGHSKVVDGGLPQFLRRLCWKDQEHKLHPIHVLVNFAGYYICNYYPDLFSVWISNMMQYDAISSSIGNIGWKMNEHDAYLKHFEAPSRFGGFWGPSWIQAVRIVDTSVVGYPAEDPGQIKDTKWAKWPEKW